MKARMFCLLMTMVMPFLHADERAMAVEFKFGGSKTVTGVSHGGGTVMFRGDGPMAVGHMGTLSRRETLMVETVFKERPADTTVIRTNGGVRYFLVSYAGAARFRPGDERPLNEREILKEVRWGRVYMVVTGDKWEQGVYNVRSADWDEKEDGDRWGGYLFLPEKKPEGEARPL